ncbi:carbohydrate-binding family 9-like protein [bacterium]|nr:carbohydrate-binding family 9-like protein [bacterium]
MAYTVARALVQPEGKGLWDGPAWSQGGVLKIADFHPKSSDHRPVTRVKALYDSDGIYLFFNVQDRCVRCVHTDYQSDVYKDSCVEFFVRPKPDKGYFNFEMNCGGALLCSHVRNWTRTADGFEDFERLSRNLGEQVRIYHSMPQRIDPEIEEPVNWLLEAFVPFQILEPYVGKIGDPAGEIWRANFFKCGEEMSHPHWASWSPVTGPLNFHRPECFGEIEFEKQGR